MRDTNSLTPEEARQLALHRLSVREYSARELLAYLRRKGVGEEVASGIVERLVEDKLLDDARYARAVTRSQSIRGKGPLFILSKLKQKGVRIELGRVRELFAEHADQDELAMARSLVERRYPRAHADPKERQRAYSALLRRGFSADVARRCLSGTSAGRSGIPGDLED